VQRKSTLLVEYKQLRKSNAFIDRRFGEDDDSLTADERAILRFQKQRMREMAGSKFTLAEGDAQEDQLTHLGQSLAELQGGGGGGGEVRVHTSAPFLVPRLLR
jgi:nucleolar protein 14